MSKPKKPLELYDFRRIIAKITDESMFEKNVYVFRRDLDSHSPVAGVYLDEEGDLIIEVSE